jgi:hypothetical protein
MNNLPRLELTEDPDNKNEYIIYRYSRKMGNNKTVTQKQRNYGTKIKHNTKKKYSTKKKYGTKRKSRKPKSLFNIF